MGSRTRKTNTKKIWTAALLFGVPWAILMIMYYAVVRGEINMTLVLTNLLAGLFGGLLVALALQYFSDPVLKKIKITVNADEHMIKEGGANHFKGIEGVGGKLVLTNKRLIFKSHKLNIQTHQDAFELEQIEKLHTTKTFRFLENGLVIQLTNSDVHKFIVDEPKAWVDEIVDQKQLVS